MLKIDIQDREDATLVRCLGRIVRGDGAESLAEIMTGQAKEQLVIDLSQVRAIDAAGLGALAMLQLWAHRSRRKIRLLNPSRSVREALQSTGLDAVLEIAQADPARRTA